MKTFNEWVAEEEAKNPAFKAESERLRPLFEFRSALIRARQDTDLTQKQLAQKMETTQSAIARLESGTQVPTLDTLLKLTKALGVDFNLADGKLSARPARGCLVAPRHGLSCSGDKRYDR